MRSSGARFHYVCWQLAVGSRCCCCCCCWHGSAHITLMDDLIFDLIDNWHTWIQLSMIGRLAWFSFNYRRTLLQRSRTSACNHWHIKAFTQRCSRVYLFFIRAGGGGARWLLYMQKMCGVCQEYKKKKKKKEVAYKMLIIKRICETTIICTVNTPGMLSPQTSTFINRFEMEYVSLNRW